MDVWFGSPVTCLYHILSRVYFSTLFICVKEGKRCKQGYNLNFKSYLYTFQTLFIVWCKHIMYCVNIFGKKYIYSEGLKYNIQCRTFFCQVYFIYEALFIINIVSKQLYRIQEQQIQKLLVLSVSWCIWPCMKTDQDEVVNEILFLLPACF